MKIASLFAVMISGSALSAEQQVHWYDYREIANATNQLVHFDELGFAGHKKKQDTLLVYPGLKIGERFAGQSVVPGDFTSYLRDFDVVKGEPVFPLSVIQGGAGKNLSLFKMGGILGTSLYGESWIGYPSASSGGEGAVAFFFEEPQSFFGFQVHAASGVTRYALGEIRVHCFDIKGKSLGRLIFEDLLWDTVQGLGVMATNGAKSIKGCTVENTDPKGVIYDNIVFDFGDAFLS